MNMDKKHTFTMSPATLSQNLEEEDRELVRANAIVEDERPSAFVPTFEMRGNKPHFACPEAVRDTIRLPVLLFDEQSNAEVLLIRQRKYGKLMDEPLVVGPQYVANGRINWLRMNAAYPVTRPAVAFHPLDRVYVWTYVQNEWEMAEWIPGKIPRKILEKVYLRDCYLEYKPFEITTLSFQNDFDRYLDRAYMLDSELDDVSLCYDTFECCVFGSRIPESEKHFRKMKYEQKHTQKDDDRDARYWREKFQKLEAKYRKECRKNKPPDTGAFIPGDRKPEATATLPFLFGRESWRPERTRPPRTYGFWLEMIVSFSCTVACVAFKWIFRSFVVASPICTAWAFLHFQDSMKKETKEDAELRKKAAEAREKEIREEERKNAFLKAKGGQKPSNAENVPDVTDLLSDFAGAMLILSTANTWNQVGRQLAGIAMLKFNKQHAEFIEKMFNKYVVEGFQEFEKSQGRDPSARKPEGPLGDISLKIRELRANSITLKDSPIGKALAASMTLFSYTYYADEDGKVDLSETRIAELMKYCDLKMTCDRKELIPAFFDIAEFALHFADTIRNNPQGLGIFLFPQTVTERVAYLKENIAEFENGNLDHKFKINPEKFYNEAVSLEVDLKIMIDKFKSKKVQVTPAMQALYTGYLRSVQEYIIRMEKAKIFFTFRPRCLGVAITGKSGTGKTTLAEQVIHTLGTACGFAHDARHIWNAKDGKYDDGLLPGATVYNFDDVGNGKMGDQQVGEELLSRLVKYINNAVCLSTQADVANKGAIAYEPELLILTSNRKNLNASRYTNDLESFFGRLLFFEATVKEYYRLPNGKINQERASINDPVHELQEYRCEPSPTKAPDDGGSRPAEKSRVGITTRNVGSKMASEDFMKSLILRYKLNRMRQLKIVKDYTRMSVQEICPTCELFTTWCKCAECGYDEDAALDAAGFSKEEKARYKKNRAEETAAAAEAKVDAEMKETHGGTKAEPTFAMPRHKVEVETVNEDDEREAEALFGGLSDIPGALMLDIVTRLATIKFPRLRTKIGTCIANFAIGIIAGACKGFCKANLSQKMTTVMSFGIMFGAGLYPSYMLFQTHPNTALFALSMTVTGIGLVAGHVRDLAARASVVMIEDYIKVGVSPLTISFRVLAIGIGLRAAAQTVMNLSSATGMTPQALMPSTVKQVKQKMEEPDLWAMPVVARPPKDTMNEEQAWNAVSRYFVRIGRNNLAYALSSNVFLLPRHMVVPLNTSVEVSLLPAQNTNKSWGVLYGRYDFPDKDFSIVRYTNSVNIEGGMAYLPTTRVNYKSGFFHLFRGNEWQRYPTSLKKGLISNGVQLPDGKSFTDMGYQHRVMTEGGDCMSPIMSPSSPYGKIIGFHAGGTKIIGHADGCAFELLQSDVAAALSAAGIVVPQCVEYDDTAMEGYPLKEMTEKVHERAVSNFVPLGTQHTSRVKVLGGLPTSSVTAKSRLIPSFIHEHIQGRANRHGPPQFRKNRNYAEYFQKSLQGLAPIDPVAVEWAVSDYLEPMHAMSKIFPWNGDCVLSFDQAVNGIDRNRFVSSINLQTAGGPGYGKKTKHFDVIDDKKYAHQPVEDATLWLLDAYRAGRLVIPRFSTGLKDEATLTFEVAGKDKVRIFFVAPTHFLLVGKMLFAKIHSFLMTFPQVSELMGSLNHCTSEWSELYEFITKYEHLFDGDYSKYDTRQTKQTFDAARDVFVEIGSMLGYADHDLTAISMYMDAMCHASLEFNGVMLEYSMWMKSGVWITLLLNGVTNALLVRMVYFNMGFKEYFRDYVSLAIQGDDMCGSTSLEAFNMISMAEEFARIGMPFTSASKQSQTKAFTTIEEVSFCSRTFHYNEYLKSWEGPLEMDSIWKSLFWHMSGGLMSSEEVILGDVWSKLIEMSRHGRVVYEAESERLLLALEGAGISRSHLDCPSLNFDDILRWRKQNHYVRQAESVDLRDPMHAEMYIPPYNVRASRIGYHTLSRRRKRKACDLAVFVNHGVQASSPLSTPHVKFRMTSMMMKDFSRQTKPEEEDRIVHNVTYMDEEVGWISGGTGEWEESQDIARDKHTNDSIVERPVQIAQYEWTPGSGFNVRFDPWKQVCEDSAVINRLALHHLLKADLHITFLINGGPFYYGRLLASYNYMNSEDNYTLAAANDAVSLMQLSQLPHVLLDPRASEGGSLLCPFVWRNHSLEIPQNEWQQMGELHIQELNPLQHANGSDDPVTVTVIARLMNVHLSVPTSELPSAITPQSGEYGMISGPMQTAADFAGKFEETPYIGKYAKATQMIASTGAKVAKMFGFSAPRLQGSVNCVQQPNLAVTDEEFRGSSLAITSKRETTIDPRTVGAPGVDELSISSMARRWSYLTQFEWSTSDGPSNGLFFMDVTPMLGALTTTEFGQRGQITPMGFAALPFAAWTGDIEVKFQVVCSAHHRGRLRFSHDPWAVPEDIGTVMNRNITGILDITSATEYVQKIGWSQATNYLETLGSNSLEDVLPGYSTVPRSRNFNANGQVGVTIVTGLSSPATEEQTVTVNVFVRAGENFLVHDPQFEHISGFSFASLPLPEAPDPPNQSPDTAVQDPDPVLVEYVGDPRGYMDDFTQNGLDALPNIGVNNTDTLVLRTGTVAAAVRSYANVGEQQSFDIRLRATATGTSTLVWNDQVTGATTLTFTGIGDTQTATVTLPPGGREGVVFWNFTLTSGARMAIEQLTTRVPNTLQLNKLTPSQMVSLYPGTIVAGEFLFSADTTLQFADLLFDGSVNLESLNDGFYETLTGANGVNGPFVVTAGTSLSAIYYWSEVAVPESADVDVKEGDEGNPESDHIDQMVHDTPFFNATDVFYGEPCVSFRPLLKRFDSYYNMDFAAGAVNSGRLDIPHFPFVTITGAAPGVAITSKPAINNTLYTYLRTAFVTEKGSMRVKLIKAGETGSRLTHTTIKRAKPGGTLAPLTDHTGGAGFHWAGSGYSYSILTGEGSFELPWYNLRRFFPARLTAFQPSPQYLMPKYQLTVGASGGANVDVCYATAEDYQLSIFTHVPAFDF